MRNVLFSAILTLIGGLVAAVFGAMMMVPEPTLVANLETFGLAPPTGLVLGLAIAGIGVILVVLGLRNGVSSGHAIVEARQIIGSSIENNYSERSERVAKADVIMDSTVRGNVLIQKPDERGGK